VIWERWWRPAGTVCGWSGRTAAAPSSRAATRTVTAGGNCAPVNARDLAARQRHALTHPMNEASGDLAPFRTVRRHARGFLLVAILAVER
jgi:hypothetical protein